MASVDLARSMNRTVRAVLHRLDSAIAARRVSSSVPAVFPWRLAAEVADEVDAVLAGQGIEHWSVEPRHTRITMWGVRRADTEPMLAALRRRFAGRGYRLQTHTLLNGSREQWLDARSLRLDDPDVVGVTVIRAVLDQSTGLVNSEAACDIQLWDPTPRGTLAAADRRGVVQEILDQHPIPTVPVERWDGRALPRPVTAVRRDASEIDFPVDAVYLWVDDSDPAWRQRRDEARRRLGIAAPPDAAAAHRFRDRGELRASLRSLEMYAPWIRRIYLVTDQQRPEWLDPASDRITLVDHRDIFTDTAVLPSFNSHAISSQLHHIEGISARYLLMNDDVMFNQAVTPETFFTTDGLLRVTLSRSRRPLLDPELLTDLERARANSARLIERDHGEQVTRLFAHVPIPQSVEVAREIEELYAAEIAQTLSHPFRSPDDYVISSWLHLNRALFTARAVLTPLRFAYYDIGRPETRAIMGDPTSRPRAAALCVNDVQVDDAEEASSWLTQWLAQRFPVPASFERRA